MLDLMKALGYPVLLVARRGLGTINHTLLSIEALRGGGLEIMGAIFNEIEDVEPDFIKEDNPEAIKSFGRVEILGNIDFLAQLKGDPDMAWGQFERCMPGLTKLLE